MFFMINISHNILQKKGNLLENAHFDMCVCGKHSEGRGLFLPAAILQLFRGQVFRQGLPDGFLLAVFREEEGPAGCGIKVDAAGDPVSAVDLRPGKGGVFFPRRDRHPFRLEMEGINDVFPVQLQTSCLPPQGKQEICHIDQGKAQAYRQQHAAQQCPALTAGGQAHRPAAAEDRREQRRAAPLPLEAEGVEKPELQKGIRVHPGRYNQISFHNVLLLCASQEMGGGNYRNLPYLIKYRGGNATARGTFWRTTQKEMRNFY